MNGKLNIKIPNSLTKQKKFHLLCNSHNIYAIKKNPNITNITIIIFQNYKTEKSLFYEIIISHNYSLLIQLQYWTKIRSLIKCINSRGNHATYINLILLLCCRPSADSRAGRGRQGDRDSACGWHQSSHVQQEALSGRHPLTPTSLVYLQPA